LLKGALEFFSGIGAFRLVAAELGIEVLAAYDQSNDANAVYRHNFETSPRARNLDTISSGELPDADLWWLSPPCKPFSRRGKQADLDDPRAIALVNLISLLPARKPRYFVMENVQGFLGSRAEALLQKSFAELSYSTGKLLVCPTQLGVPMRRPRLFFLASADGPVQEHRQVRQPLQALSEFIKMESARDSSLLVDAKVQARYFRSLDIVSAEDPHACAICFTSGYYRCMKSSGSLIAMPDNRLRYFCAEEILALLGFPDWFKFPDEMSLACRLRLAGNSVDLRSIRLALDLILPQASEE
jgi:DNA (cytosine-5)-methyltransferase 1